MCMYVRPCVCISISSLQHSSIHAAPLQDVLELAHGPTISYYTDSVRCADQQASSQHIGQTAAYAMLQTVRAIEAVVTVLWNVPLHVQAIQVIR